MPKTSEIRAALDSYLYVHVVIKSECLRFLILETKKFVRNCCESWGGASLTQDQIRMEPSGSRETNHMLGFTHEQKHFISILSLFLFYFQRVNTILISEEFAVFITLSELSFACMQLIFIYLFIYVQLSEQKQHIVYQEKYSTIKPKLSEFQITLITQCYTIM